MPLDNRFGNRQPQAGAACVAVAGFVAAIEALKDEGKFVCGDARAAILNGEDDAVAVLVLNIPPLV